MFYFVLSIFYAIFVGQVKNKLKEIAPGYILENPVIVGPAGPISILFTTEDVDNLFEFYPL